MDIDTSSSSSSLEAIKSKVPSSLHGDIDKLQDLSNKKLWHQLTNTLQAFLSKPESHPVQIELYQSFVKGLSSKLDKRRLVEIATTVAGQYEGEAAHSVLGLVDETPSTSINLATLYTFQAAVPVAPTGRTSTDDAA
jgi:hypothetical protein